MHAALMCLPSHYRVDYQINPWMQVGGVDPHLAMQQWQELVKTYRSLGVTVEVIDQDIGFPDMVFAADQGIKLGKKKILLSHFRYSERRGESAFYTNWFTTHGYEVVTLPSGKFFEGGGEVQFFGDKILVGSGFRTEREVAVEMPAISECEVIVLELIDERFYHLDTCLFVLNDEVVFYYPAAFSTDSQKKLQEMVPNLIILSQADVEHFAANSVVVGQHVLVQKGSREFLNDLKTFNYHPIEIDVSEFIKAGGGAHCLTFVLE